MIDLHTHSTASDGSLSPTALVQLAREKGISCLALTDHNTVRGLPEFLAAARGSGLCSIPGIEISCELAGKELHILALDLPESSFQQMEDAMAQVLARAEKSKRDLVSRLSRAGYAISYEQIQQENPGSVINRAHIALALKNAGYVPTVQAAFRTLLKEGGPFYRPPQRLLATEAIAIIRDLKAIPVWAHPFLSLEEGSVRRALETLVPAGLEGMEVFYSTYTPEQTRAALELAAGFGLKISGGSDFHGAPKPDTMLGTGKGNLNIPQSVAEELLRGRRKKA